MKKLLFLSALVMGLIAQQSVASAKAARCFSTDDGYFACNFIATDKRGSFEVSARGKPTYSLIVEEPGFGSGYLNFGDGGIPISGMFVRQREDPACWNNPEMNVKLCAW